MINSLIGAEYQSPLTITKALVQLSEITAITLVIAVRQYIQERKK